MSVSSETEAETPFVPRCEILVDGEEAEIFNRVALTRVLKEISYPIPATADRVPWLERLDVQTTECLPEDLDPLADVARENAFFDLALNATREGLKKLQFFGVQYTRPNDFMAEMLKDDAHMRRVESKLSSQSIRIKAVEDRKQKQFQRKHNQAKKTSSKKKK